MSKNKKILFIAIALLLPTFSAFAQTLEQIPGQTSVGSTDLMGYLNSLYKFGISITGILAIVMVAVGSFGYIVTSVGNTSKMMDAKEKITNALIGLTIALTAYLFLYVINPDLVSGTLTAPGEMVKDITSQNSDTSYLENYESGCCLFDSNKSCSMQMGEDYCNGLSSGGTFPAGLSCHEVATDSWECQ